MGTLNGGKERLVKKFFIAFMAAVVVLSSVTSYLVSCNNKKGGAPMERGMVKFIIDGDTPSNDCAEINSRFSAKQDALKTLFSGNGDEVAINYYNKAVGFQYVSGGRVVFIFSPDRFGYGNTASIERVNIEGSFTGWKKFGDDATSVLLKKYTGDDNTICYISDPLDKNTLTRPGDTGLAEYKFGVTTTTGEQIEYPDDKGIINGFQISTNHNLMLLNDLSDTADIETYETQAGTIKKLADFKISDSDDYTVDDLSGEYSWQELTNIRYVPGCAKNLIRGYHPYKKSKSAQWALDKGIDTDAMRSDIVKKAIEARGVKTIITLSDSGAEEPFEADADPNNDTGVDEKSSPYIEEIKERGAWYTYDPKGNKSGTAAGLEGHYSCDKISYNMVYYNTQNDMGRNFCDIFADIARFMIAHEGPYYVHCRLGSDRTGVTNATLAGLAGAKWGDIKKDFERTNHLGVSEFRGYRLLAYSFTNRIPGLTLKDDDPIAKELYGYFMDKKNYCDAESVPLTKEELDQLVTKLVQ